jgi:hypothetical protein
MNTEKDSHVVLSCVDQNSLLMKRGKDFSYFFAKKLNNKHI